jgi:hypothetical protein
VDQLLSYWHKLRLWLYPFILILIIIQSALKIVWRFFYPEICQIEFLLMWIKFPSLVIFLLVLYYWPIHLFNSWKLNDAAERNYYLSVRHTWIYLWKCLLLLFFSFFLLIAVLAREIYETYRLLQITLVFAVIPVHINSYFYQKLNTNSILLFLVTSLPIATIFLFISSFSYLINLSIFLLVIGLIIWALYGLSFLPKNQIVRLLNLNHYNASYLPGMTNQYRKKTLQLIGLSGITALMFLISVYFDIPRIETFALYRPAFERVVQIVKTNKIVKYNSEPEFFQMPCDYRYLTPASPQGIVKVQQEGDSLTVTFRIFSMGFGDGYTAFVYREHPFDYKQDTNYIEFKDLGNYWYWERWSS